MEAAAGSAVRSRVREIGERRRVPRAGGREGGGSYEEEARRLDRARGGQVLGEGRAAGRVEGQGAAAAAARKGALDRQLDFVVGQTQRYSSLLAQRLGGGSRESGEGMQRASGLASPPLLLLRRLLFRSPRRRRRRRPPSGSFPLPRARWRPRRRRRRQ